MAPALIRRIVAGFSAAPSPDALTLGPLAARSVLLARDGGQVISHSGMVAPTDINNNAVFALVGLIGAAFVITGIWFFFWAKNGGFHFKEDDWDDYKSTVLRRKGPNGTTLSGATESTVLGGGSVYKDVADDGSTDVDGTVITGVTAATESTEATDLTGITGGVSDVSGRERRRRKREQKERERERRREEKEAEKREKERRKKSAARDKEKKSKSARRVDGVEGVVVDEAAEAEAQEYLRNYRHERPARVGGLNKESDGSAWDGSTNPSNSTAAGGSTTDGGSTVTSDLMSNRERTPTTTPTKKTTAAPTGIRKVYSTADRNANRENERLRAEARRLQEKGRAAAAASAAASSTTSASSASSAAGGAQREFSFRRGDDRHSMAPPAYSHGGALRAIEEAPSRNYDRDHDAETHVPGSWVEGSTVSGSGVGGGGDDARSEVGTKAYHHPIPGLSSIATSDFAYQQPSELSQPGGEEEVDPQVEARRKRRSRSAYRRGREEMSEVRY